MMSESYPVPPPELVEKWVAATESNDCIGAFPTNFEQRICTAAARWGADQELEACCEWLVLNGWGDAVNRLRAARRPKPPSLKEQALDALGREEADSCSHHNLAIIRRALEALDD